MINVSVEWQIFILSKVEARGNTGPKNQALKSLRWLPVASCVEILKKPCSSPTKPKWTGARALLLGYSKQILSTPSTPVKQSSISVCPCCQHWYLWSMIFCLSLPLTLLYNYLWSTFFCLSLLSTLIPMVNVLSPLRHSSYGTLNLVL